MPTAFTPWTNQDLVLYHGTTERGASGIRADGVVLTASTRRTDFGRGFYTCTSRQQAERWARAKAFAEVPGTRPALVSFDVERDALAELQTLGFVRSAADAEDYWRFVAHCRLGHPQHGRKNSEGYYDVVFGPVMKGNYSQRLAHQDFDQISFHTERTIQVLDRFQIQSL